MKIIDDFLIDIDANGSGIDAKAVLLYCLMNSNKLFYEFMIEVVRKKFLEMDFILTKKDLNIFFERKKEQSNKVASWGDYTFYKLSQVLFKILQEAQLIVKNEDEFLLNKLLISYSLEKYFIDHDEKLFLECIGC